MPTIIFTAGAKGGTGKTTALGILINYLREHDFKPVLLDMDDESKTLSRFFPEAQQLKITANDYSHDILLDKIIEEGENLVIADLKGGTGDDTIKWWSALRFDELETEHNIKFICLASINTSPDSAQSFFTWANGLQNRVAYIVCKNKKDGDVCPDYERSIEGIRFHKNTEKLYEVEIEHLIKFMPELERFDVTIAEVLGADKLTGMTTTGKKIEDLTLLKYTVRARLRTFQEGIYKQFEPILEFLKE
jgi:hypothetical protein